MYDEDISAVDICSVFEGFEMIDVETLQCTLF